MNFTEPMLLRAAARFAVTSPIAIKIRDRRAWRSQGRHRVRKRSSRVAVASLPLLGTAARSRIAVASLPLIGAVAR
jgi:hypothetical protein